MDNKLEVNKKHIVPILWPLEQKWIRKVTPKLPSFLNGYNLTWLNIPWIVLILFFGWLAKNNISWLWASTAVIVLQYITDCLDGAVGRYRKSGLNKWGYYMDHLLDYLFVGAIIIGYSFIVPDSYFLLLAITALLGGFHINTHLITNLSNQFQMGYAKIGPTELRVFIITLNVLAIFFGSKIIATVLPYFTILLLVVLSFSIYKRQKEIIKMDLNDNHKTPGNID